MAGHAPSGEPPGGDDPDLERPPTSEERPRRARLRIRLANLVRWYQDRRLERPPTSETEEDARRDRIPLADLVRWYQDRHLPLDVPLHDYVPDEDEGRAYSSTANRMRAAANLMVARGLTVKYASGWATRGRPYSFSPSAGMIYHHTGTTDDCDSVLINGRSDLPGPLAHWALHKNGDVVLIASGYANHAGASVPGAPTNSTGWGIEATGPIPAGAYGPSAFPQYHEYEVMVACILKAEGWGTNKIWAHKESCSPPGRKVDPSFDTGPFEQGVQQAMAGAPPPGEDDVPYKDWPAADKTAMMDDVARIIGEGKKPDGTVPEHLAERSTNRIREIQDLIRVGDRSGGETDTHDYSSVEGVGRQVKDLAEQVAAQGELLNQLLAAVTGGTPTPGEEAPHAHP